MRAQARMSLVLPLLYLFACGTAAETAPPPAAPAPPAAETTVAVAPQPAPQAAPAPALSEEEQKKANDQKKLAQEFAELEQAQQAELSRLTPALRAASKALAEKSYPSARAALTAAIAGPQRAPKNVERDGQRHPLATLEFFGLKPNQSVLEIGPGEGWYTELLAPVLAKNGKLWITSGDPNGPKDQRPTLYAQRSKLFLEKLPEAYGKVETVLVDSKKPKLPFDSKLDLVVLFRGIHGMVNNQNLGAWLSEIHRALKPNGVLAVEQHRAAPGENPELSSKKGYVPEAWLIEQVGAAGFKLAAKSEINANPKDTKDYPEGVWSLPPTLREGQTNRDKYLAIGESDRMTLKFVKVAGPKPKSETAAKAESPAPKPLPAAPPARAAGKP